MKKTIMVESRGPGATLLPDWLYGLIQFFQEFEEKTKTK